MRPSESSEFDEESLKGLSQSRELRHANKTLAQAFIELSDNFTKQNPNQSLLITCTYRSPDTQKRLWLRGRNGNPGPVVTNCDGERKKSNHNWFPARAIDVCVLIGGKPVWDERFYWPLVPLARAHGLVSGGSWESFQDWPHLEMPKEG